MHSCEPNADAPAGDMPLPLPSELLPVEPFPIDVLPDSLRPWVFDVAERMQCPPDFVAMPMLTGLSSVVARKVCIRPQAKTDWTVHPNLWGLIVGRPGFMKTPAMMAALSPLDSLENSATDDFRTQQTRFEQEERIRLLRAEAIEKQLKDRLRKNPSAAVDDLIALDQPPEAPKRSRYMITDSTYEALGSILAEQSEGVLSVRDEIRGLLQFLEREENATARGFYLQGWSGGRYNFERIGRGSLTVDNLCLSMLGCIQPGPLAQQIRHVSTGGTMDDGMLQRFLICWPDGPATWRNVDRHPDTQAKRSALEVFKSIDRSRGEDFGATLDPTDEQRSWRRPFLRFSAEALPMFTDWHRALEEGLRSEGASSAMESALSKFRKHVPSLALILHIGAMRRGPVDLDAIRGAIALADYLTSHLRRAYAAGRSPIVSAAKAVMKKAMNGALPTMFTARDVHQRGWSGLTDRTVLGEALELLVAHRHLFEFTEPAGPTGGRPRDVFTVNPAIERALPLRTPQTEIHRHLVPAIPPVIQ